jgi:hypothetical protein
MLRRAFICLLLAAGARAALAAPSESLESYAKLAVPEGSELAWPVAKVAGWGPGGARLAVWRSTEGAAPLKGAVVYLKGPGYVTAPLPPSPYPGWGLFEVKDVFVAHRGPTPLLFVRADHMTGIGPTGARPFSVTWVYRWNGKAPIAEDKLTERIGQAESRKVILTRAGAHH